MSPEEAFERGKALGRGDPLPQHEIDAEHAMRNSTAPTPKTPLELQDYIEGLVKQDHTYGTCVYAMSLAATAVFNYVASALGCTGFQAGCADMDIIRRTRGYKGPFMIIDGNDALYPQYDTQARVDKFFDEIRPWLAEQAQERLKETEEDKFVSLDVRNHWLRLAAIKEAA